MAFDGMGFAYAIKGHIVISTNLPHFIEKIRILQQMKLMGLGNSLAVIGNPKF